jgi:hypothetical protein
VRLTCASIAWHGKVPYCTSACREASFQKKRAGEDSKGIDQWSMYGQRYDGCDKQRLEAMPIKFYLMRDWESERP